MKITLDLPDGMICAFFYCVEHAGSGLQLASYQLSSDDLADGKTIKLPRERHDD